MPVRGGPAFSFYTAPLLRSFVHIHQTTQVFLAKGKKGSGIQKGSHWLEHTLTMTRGSDMSNTVFVQHLPCIQPNPLTHSFMDVRKVAPSLKADPSVVLVVPWHKACLGTSLAQASSAANNSHQFRPCCVTLCRETPRHCSRMVSLYNLHQTSFGRVARWCFTAFTGLDFRSLDLHEAL